MTAIVRMRASRVRGASLRRGEWTPQPALSFPAVLRDVLPPVLRAVPSRQEATSAAASTRILRPRGGTRGLRFGRKDWAAPEAENSVRPRRIRELLASVRDALAQSPYGLPLAVPSPTLADSGFSIPQELRHEKPGHVPSSPLLVLAPRAPPSRVGADSAASRLGARPAVLPALRTGELDRVADRSGIRRPGRLRSDRDRGHGWRRRLRWRGHGERRGGVAV